MRMENIIWGVLLTLAGVLVAWLGVRRRKNARKQYESDAQVYTASTTMTVVEVEESEFEEWRELDDGRRELERTTVYAPTYEYTVDGKTYRHRSSRYSSGVSVGQRVMGYYDPADPSHITDTKPRKPVLGGFGFFACAVFLLAFAVVTFAGMVEFY